MPLADVSAFYLAGPLFVTALSVPLLGEAVGPRRWAACIAGFLGVLVMLRPSGASFSWPAAIALGGSFTFAISLIVTRQLRATSSLTLIVWQTGATLAMGGVASIAAWRPPDALDLALLALLGVVALAGHWAVTLALQLAEAAVVIPFQYTMLLWAIVLGFVFFGDVPQPPVLLGAALVVASGLYVYHRERRLSQGAAVPSGPVAGAQAGPAVPD